jgi:hypothetical protein
LTAVVKTVKILVLCIFSCLVCKSAFAGLSWFPRIPADKNLFFAGEGSLEIDFTWKNSSDFFDSSGNKLNSSDPSFPGGSRQEYSEIAFIVTAAYSFIDNLDITLTVPVRSRQETSSLKGSKTGIGDVSLTVQYMFYEKLLLSLLTSLKFPSGSTGLSYDGDETFPYTDLPLGTGQTDLFFGLNTRQRIGFIGLTGSTGYNIRFEASPSYLLNDFVTFTDANGVSSVYPLGNKKIDYGDEAHASLGADVHLLKNFSLGFDIAYKYQRSSTVTVSSITGDDIVSSKASLASSHLLKITPEAMYAPGSNVKLFARTDIPLWGKNYPVMPLSESLVGIGLNIGIKLFY